MKQNPELPERVFRHGRWYRIVVAQGKKRVPHKLSLVADGLPALWRAYKAFVDEPSGQYLMPALIADWEDKVLALRAPSTIKDTKRQLVYVSEFFAEYAPDQPGAKVCDEFLANWADKPRSYNGYRGLLRELFDYAIRRELRPLGTNPCAVIGTMPTPPRERCPTTSELRRMKVACLYGQSGGRINRKARTRTGLTMAAFIEVAYLSGQDVGRIVLLRESPNKEDPNEPFITREGISFRRSKTGGRVVIEWTPRLLAAVAALRRIKAERLKKAKKPHLHPYLFTKQDSSSWDYEAMANCWQRGMARFLEDGGQHFKARDIRARALTDKDARDGRQAANAMGTHTTEGQTTDYIRHKTPRKTKATA